MAFRFERDDARAEVRKDVAGTIAFFPKVDGLGNVTVSAATFELRKPGGEVLQAATNAGIVTSGGISRLDLAIPAIAALGEDYFAIIRYTPDGAVHAGENFERVEQLQFDVVLQPWGPSRVSLNDLEQKVPTIRGRLARVLDALNAGGATGLTVDQVASIFAHQAHAELYRKIRNKIGIERAQVASRGSSVTTAAPLYPAHLYTRPRLLVDRVALQPIEVPLTLACIYEGDIADGVDQREARAQAEHWRGRADEEFLKLADLAYDFSEDRTPDRTIEKLSGVVVARRVQAR
jgi:hypothetical protein